MWGPGAYGGDGEGNGADDPGDVGRGGLGGGVSSGTAERGGAGDVAGRDFGDTGGAESCAGEHRVGCFFIEVKRRKRFLGRFERVLVCGVMGEVVTELNEPKGDDGVDSGIE